MARRSRQRATRAARKSWAFTRRAIDTSGSGGVSTQWLISSSEPAVPPRLGSQLAGASSAATLRNRNGVSCMTAG